MSQLLDMNLKMDLSQEGLLMFFKPYQLDSMKAIWGATEPMSTRDVWEAVGEDKISRASVINFLVVAREVGLLTMFEKTGKGGHRAMYSAAMDEVGARKYLKNIFQYRLDQL